VTDVALPAVIVLGEVLWDVFGETRRLGGAPLNFAATLKRLGHPVTLVSGLGADALGREAAAALEELGFDTRLVQTSARFRTGTAEVALEPDGAAAFTIPRPAAYDAIELSARDIEHLQRPAPAWFYFGTLFASTGAGRRVLDTLLDALGGTLKLYDLNLRPGADSPALVTELLGLADVVKLNEHELETLHALTGLPLEVEAFCRAACERYGWRAVSVTLGERGSALLAGGHYVEAPAHPVAVADTVGAGDAFAAAFMHGLSRQWPAREIAAFANRVAARTAASHSSLPDWTAGEIMDSEAPFSG
jgi:fructokinase